MKTESVFWTKLKKLVEIERIAFGRNDKTSFGIVDSKSVKNADTAEQKGYDVGKKVSGIKYTLRLMLSDCLTQFMSLVPMLPTETGIGDDFF